MNFLKLRYLLLAAVLSLNSSLLFAADHIFSGCTADHKVATLTIGLREDVTNSVQAHIRKMFVAVAVTLPATGLVGPEGYEAFLSALNDKDRDAITYLTVPVIGGACR